MISGRSILAVIPARGGSKGLPRKNILPLNGRPLIAWSIQSAHQSEYLDRTIVSTDDLQIATEVRRYGGDLPFVRPAVLASDEATTAEVLRHAIEAVPEFDIAVVLQPTTPLRSHQDIDEALRLMVAQGASSLVSVTTPDKSPYWSYTLNQGQRLVPLLGEELACKRRQELPHTVTLNGAIYAVEVEHFLNTGRFVDADTLAYEMPKERSLDIDTEQDLQIARYLVSQSEQYTGDTLPVKRLLSRRSKTSRPMDKPCHPAGGSQG